MYRRKRFIALIMAFTVIIAAFTGCGAGSGNTAAEVPGKNEAAKVTPTSAPTIAPTATPTPAPTTVDYKTAAAKDIWKDYFLVGAVLNGGNVGNASYQELVRTNFNSMTMENEMKPDSLLDWNANSRDPKKYNESPAVNFNRAESLLKFAKENGLKLRGHTLVWHSQTPKWFFMENYSTAADAKFVSRDLMLKRMENYIKQVMEYVQTNYPDVIYAWDVVNEAIQTSDGDPDGLRTGSLWYQVVGTDYIEKAFEYARKYAAPGVKLFYNDYGTEDPSKVAAITKLLKKLIDQGTIDGMGMQTHIRVDSPPMSAIDSSARAYAKLELELQVTELDVDMKSNSEEDLQKQAIRYKRLFVYFKKWVDDGIKLTSVTFWGTTDNKSWLNKPNEPSYPLLFDAKLQKKPAFYGMLLDPEIPIY